MAHFSLLDLSHAAFDDTSKAYRAVTTTLILPLFYNPPLLKYHYLVCSDNCREPVSDRNHGSTIRKLMTLESTAQTQSPALVASSRIKIFGLGAARAIATLTFASR